MHANDLSGIHDFHRRPRSHRVRGQLTMELLFRPNQQHTHAGIMTSGQQRSFDLRLGSPVRSHCIDSYYGFHESVRLSAFFYFHHLATLVVPALGAGAMRELALMAVGALRNRVGHEKIVRATP
jgi:hypothetical protein